ncbi:MAG TPA: adenosylcobinamide amidohydrolase [Actinophytocola sp.]|uniref:adenosylcobinamide amidohydrolase n=1 Tax=Actinophytocola sp. TaxID=1872138 RepID=UPI002DC05D33|nr:adenosylcobinamide amidohydrolase [Actinophytocola sp.]HEU5475805.1 adenosylcobinamide amidohydrolase [Actinophytocola sp.]
MRPPAAELAPGPMLVWRCARPWLAISSAPLGGGLGERSWVVNATVPAGYRRLDPDVHLAGLAGAAGLTGAGVGLLTAVDVRDVVHETDSGVQAWVTTGIGGHPTWAAAGDPVECPSRVGTINAVCWLPVRLAEAALVNAVATVAEAKAQALVEAGIAGTGTATDATVLLCPPAGPAEPFGGPRSPVGAALARAVHAAIRAGLRASA